MSDEESDTFEMLLEKMFGFTIEVNMNRLRNSDGGSSGRSSGPYSGWPKGASIATSSTLSALRTPYLVALSLTRTA